MNENSNAATESTKFNAAITKILSVSHDELKRREEEWKKQHKGRKAGRKRSRNR
jgi:hypothetical protein